MKKVFTLFLFAVLVSQISISQIVLHQTDFGSAGMTFDQRTDWSPDDSIDPGPGGANQTWNFSMLASEDTSIVSILNPSATPLGYLYTGANEAVNYDGISTNYYFTLSSSHLLMNGFTIDVMGNGDTIRVVFSSPDTVMMIPSVLNQTVTSSAFGDTKSPTTYTIDTNILGTPLTILVDSVRVKHWQNDSWQLDGWGTLQLSSGQTQVLRQNQTITTVDSIFGLLLIPPPYNMFSGWYSLYQRADTAHQYTFWAKYIGVPLVKINWDNAGDTATSADWLHYPSIGISETDFSGNSSLSPNPVSDNFAITSTEPIETVAIFNLSGQLLFSTQGNGMQKVNISGTELSNGMYFAQVRCLGGEIFTEKFIIKH